MAFDPYSVITSAALAKVGAELGVDVLKRLYAPLVDHLGDKLKERALRRTQPVLAEAHEILEGSGRALTDIPDRMLIPILEKAALNDDDDIASKWARLLASSALRLDEVYPAYIDILANLSPAEGAALDSLWKKALEKVPHAPEGFRFLLSFAESRSTFRMEGEEVVDFKTISPDLVFGKFRVSPVQASIFASNFVRLGLWSIQPINAPLTEDKVHEIIDGKMELQTLGRYVTDHPGLRKFKPAEPEFIREYKFSSLGGAFMRICTSKKE